MSELNRRWLDWISNVPMSYDYRHIASVQRMYQHLTFKYKKRWDLTLEETGYTTVKLTQLKTYYLPEENLFRAMDMLQARIHKRKYGSVLIPHQGRLKRGFTQNDYCMIGTTLTFYPRIPGIAWSTHWRSTEAIKRCRGDFLLIQYMIDRMQTLFDQAPILDFTFKFDTLTFHPMMVPLMFPHIDWKMWLSDIRNLDSLLYRDVLRWLKYYLINPEETYKKYSSAHQVHKILYRQLPAGDMAELIEYVGMNCDGGPRG